MASGFLYILSNPSIPGLAKVDKTTRDPAQRVAELSSTIGVASPFVLLYQQPVANSDAAEAWVHEAMTARGWRNAGNREFFAAPLHEIVALVSEAATQTNAGSDDDACQRQVSTVAEEFPFLSEADHLCELALQNPDGTRGRVRRPPPAVRMMVHAAEQGSVVGCRIAGTMLMRSQFDLKQDLRKPHGFLARAIEAGEYDCHALMRELLLLNHQRDAAQHHFKAFFNEAALRLQAADTETAATVRGVVGAPGRTYCQQVYRRRIDDCVDDLTFAVLAPRLRQSTKPTARCGLIRRRPSSKKRTLPANSRCVYCATTTSALRLIHGHWPAIQHKGPWRWLVWATSDNLRTRLIQYYCAGKQRDVLSVDVELFCPCCPDNDRNTLVVHSKHESAQP